MLPCLPLLHVFEALIADIERALVSSVLLRVRAVVPGVDLIVPEIDLLYVSDPRLLLVLLF